MRPEGPRYLCGSAFNVRSGSGSATGCDNRLLDPTLWMTPLPASLFQEEDLR